MKKLKMLMLAVIVFFAASNANNLFAAEVELLSAFSAVGSYNGSYQEAKFKILVENLAYNKEVSIYMEDTDGTWFDLPATYTGPANNNKELWTVTYSGGYMYPIRDFNFAVKYIVNGQTYWDNNNGNNYILGSEDGMFLNNINVLNYYNSDQIYSYNGTAYYTLDICVRNIALNKSVKIVYTTDNWNTQSEVDAEYISSWSPVRTSIPSPNIHGIEEWRYNFIITGGAQTLKYAIKYTVNGQDYWDNNFGMNYVTDIIEN